MILGICGLAKSGKSSAAKVLSERHEFTEVAFGDPIKRICMDVFDFTTEQLWGNLKEVPDKRYPRGHTWGFGQEFDGAKCVCCGFKPGPATPLSEAEQCFLTPRYAMQTLGTEWGRGCYDSAWSAYTIRMSKLVLSLSAGSYSPVRGLHPPVVSTGAKRVNGVVIPDVRFINEWTAIKAAGGKVVRIKRPGYENPQWNHPSETEQLLLEDDQFDYILHNDGGLEELVDRISYLMLPILEGRPQCVPER